MEKEPRMPMGEGEATESQPLQPERSPEAAEASLESTWREKLAESAEITEQVSRITAGAESLDTPDAPIDEADRKEMRENQSEAEALAQAEAELGDQIKQTAAAEAEGEGGAQKASIGDLLAATLRQQKGAGQRRIEPGEGVRVEDVAAAAGVEAPRPAESEPGSQRISPLEGVRAEDVAAAAGVEAPKSAGPESDWRAKMAEHADELMDQFAEEDRTTGKDVVAKAIEEGLLDKDAPLAPDIGEAIKRSETSPETRGTIDRPEQAPPFDYEAGPKVVVAPELPQAAEAEAVRQQEASVQAAEQERMKETAAERRQKSLEEVGNRIADLSASLKRFEGLGAAKLLSGKNRREREMMLKELEQTKQEYAEVRTEAVGENLRLALDERMEQAERMRESLEREKGLSTKVYDSFKKLGELNLTKLGWKPKGRLGQMVARAASVRTAISLGLLGGGLALGGAASAAGLGAIGLRRLLGGMGAGVGSYDLMRMVADRRAGNFTPEELEKMDETELSERMAKLEARAAAGGTGLRGNEAYQQLRRRLERTHGFTSAEQAADMPFEEMSEEQRAGLTPDQLLEMAERPKSAAERIVAMMESADAQLIERARKDQRNDRIMKGVAAGLAVVVGSGALAKGVGWASEQSGLSGAYRSAKESMKHWLGLESAPASGGAGVGAAAETAPAKAPGAGAAAEAAPETPPGKMEFPPDEVTRSPESLAKDAKLHELAQVHQGDNYYRLIGRQLEADPGRFGYNPATDGDVDKWAKRMTSQIVRENKLIGQGWDQRLRFDPNNPSSVELKYDPAAGKFSLEQSGAGSYRYVQPDADQILKESVEATRAEMGQPPTLETPTAAPAEIKTPAWAKEVLSPQDQMRATAKAWQSAGITKDSLEKLIGATEGQKEVVLSTADGKALRVPVDIETKRAAVEALENMEKGGAKAVASAVEAGQPVPGEGSVNTGKRWLNEGVTRESLEKLAKGPAIGGELKSLQTVDGRTIVVEGGTDAKLAANAALEQLNAREAAAAAAKQAAGTAAETPPTGPAAAEGKDIFGGYFSEQQKSLGKSWIERGATKESLEALANGPARGGEFLDLKTSSGGTIRVAGGFDAQRAAKAALEQLKNQGK